MKEYKSPEIEYVDYNTEDALVISDNKEDEAGNIFVP
jgi:hypothetical protein